MVVIGARLMEIVSLMVVYWSYDFVFYYCEFVVGRGNLFAGVSWINFRLFRRLCFFDYIRVKNYSYRSNIITYF